MSTTFYKKVGKRYIAVSEYNPELRESLTEGNHLVIVKPGNTSYHFNIDPNSAPLLAASLNAKKEMINAIAKAGEAKPKIQPLTTEQVNAWNKLQSTFNDDYFGVYYNSADKIADAGIQVLTTEVNKMLENPSVKKAYEQFLLIWKLTKDEQK